mgnify:CR=1 FL=1
MGDIQFIDSSDLNYHLVYELKQLNSRVWIFKRTRTMNCINFDFLWFLKFLVKRTKQRTPV